MSLTKIDYNALSAALREAAPRRSVDPSRADLDVQRQHAQDCTAVADAIQRRKTGGGFDRGKFLDDCGLTDGREYPHRETYRGVGFHQTRTGVWAFDTIPPRHPYSWHAYMREGDAEGAAGMRQAIDRCVGGAR